MSYTEITRLGYGRRLTGSLGGAVVGLVLFLVSFILLFWNEGRAVTTARSLEEGASAVVSVAADSVNPQYEGKLVHFSGNTSASTLKDPLLGVSAQGVHLNRYVEMFQWYQIEHTASHKDTVGGGETKTTTYTYEKKWSHDLIDSNTFHVKNQGYNNPPAKRVNDDQWTADSVTVGAFSLPRELIDKMIEANPFPLESSVLENLPSDLQGDAAISDTRCYISGQPGRQLETNSPQVGDVRIALKLVPAGPVSVIAKQTGSTLAAYPTRAGDPQEFLYTGIHPAAEMYASEQHKNTAITWMLRGVGFLLMWFGLIAILNPLKILSDVIGILGTLVGSGLALVAFLVAAVLSSLTIAVAWVTYRPLVGMVMIGVAVVVIAVLVKRWMNAAARRRAMPLPPPVPLSR